MKNETWDEQQSMGVFKRTQEEKKGGGGIEIPVSSEEISHPSEQNGRKRASAGLCPNALLVVLSIVNECRDNPRQHGIKRRVS